MKTWNGQNVQLGLGLIGIGKPWGYRGSQLRCLGLIRPQGLTSGSALQSWALRT